MAGALTDATKERTARHDCWLLAVLVAHVSMLIGGILVHSPTRDEIVHVSAGLHMWRTGRFDVNIGNPPLCDLVATLPLLIMKGDIRIVHSGHYLDSEYHRNDGESVQQVVVCSRLALIPFSIVGALVCYWWAYDVVGLIAARIAVVLWCTCPNILALGQIVTADLTCAATGVLAGFCLWKWLCQFDSIGAVTAGAGVGLAMLSKMLWVIWLVVVPVLWLSWIVCERPTWPTVRRSVFQLAIVLVAAVLLVNVGYAFEQTGTPIPHDCRCRLLGGWEWAERVCAGVPLPLPGNYVRGLCAAHRVMTSGQTSYLRGEWRSRGWWYYYGYGLLVKIPLGTWAFAIIVLWQIPKWGGRRRDFLALAIPGASIFSIVSSLSGLSHHFRYILPFFPYVFIPLAVFGATLWRGGSLGRWMVASCVGLSVVGSAAQYPRCLSYFNELAGGQIRGHRHLIDSSIDWGQDLFLLKEWLSLHPEASPLHLAYFGSIPPQIIGINMSIPPPGPTVRIATLEQDWEVQPGWYAVSVNLVCGRPSESVDAEGRPTHAEQDKYAYFQLLSPIERVGGSIWIYHISEEQAKQLQWQFGWRPNARLAETSISNTPKVP